MRRRHNRFNTRKFTIKRRLSHDGFAAVAHYFKTTTGYRSEAVFAGERDDAGRALQANAGVARGVVLDLARIRVEVVIGQAHTEMLVDIPAGAHAAIPAAAIRATAVGEAEILANAVVVIVVVVIGAEVTAVAAEGPAGHEGDLAVDTQHPTTQRVLGVLLVDVLIRLEHVLYAVIAQIGVAGLEAQAEILTDLPAITAEKAVARATALFAVQRIEATDIAAEATGVASVGATDVGADKPVAATHGLARLVIAGDSRVAVLGEGRNGRKRDARNCKGKS